MNWQEFQNWHGEVLEEGAEIAKAIGLLLLMLFIGLPLMILFSPIWLILLSYILSGIYFMIILNYEQNAAVGDAVVAAAVAVVVAVVVAGDFFIKLGCKVRNTFRKRVERELKYPE